MATITKRDIVMELSNRTGMTQNQVSDVFQAGIDLIIEELAKGNDIALRRFGTYEVRLTKPKVGRNPNKPNIEVQIPPRAVVRFKPGKELKEVVAAALPRLLNGNNKSV